MPNSQRRQFLHAATGALGAVGLAAVAWPLLDQMNPDARVVAAADVVAFDLSALRPGQRAVATWRGMPILVHRRTLEDLKVLEAPDVAAKRRDPESNEPQQPPYAKNRHRSLNPDYGVFVNICTRCRCIPVAAENSVAGEAGMEAGGSICPCCAARFDLAGRAYRDSVALYNLPTPPYSFPSKTLLLIGKNPAGQSFAFESVKSV